MYFQSLRHGFGGLIRFSGRDSPKLFWPFAGTVLGATLAVYMVLFLIMIAGTVGKILKFAATHPDQADVTVGPGSYSVQLHGHHPELMPDFQPLIGLVAVMVLVLVALLAAAVVRRLHDSNMRGYIALVPLALLVSGLAQMARLLAAISQGSEPEINAFQLIFANNFAYLLSLGGLVFLLIRRGDQVPNRFGEPPGR